MATPQSQVDPFADIADLFASGDDRAAVRSYALSKAAERGLDPQFVDRLFTRESGYNRRALNKQTNAAGIGQQIPATQRRYGLKDPFDAKANVDTSLDYLADLNKKFNGNQKLMAAGYFAGEGQAEKALANPAANPKTAAYTKAIAGDPFADISDLFEGGAQTPAQPSGPIQKGKLGEITINAGPPSQGVQPANVTRKIGGATRIDVSDILADLDAKKITPDQFKAQVTERYATQGLGFEPSQVPVARQWAESQQAGYDPFALLESTDDLIKRAKASGGRLGVKISGRNAQILESLRNSELLNPMRAQAERTSPSAQPKGVMGQAAADIQAAGTQVGAGVIQTVYNLWKLSGGEKPVESEFSRRLLDQAQAEAEQSPGATNEIARGLLQGLFATPEYIAAAQGGPLGFAALGAAEQAHRGGTEAVKSAAINAIIGAALHGAGELTTTPGRVTYSAGVGGVPAGLEAATQGATPEQAAIAAIPGAVQMGVLGALGGKENAVEKGKQQIDNQAEFRGVRPGENLPAYEGKVRGQEGERAAGGGGAEGGGQVPQEQVAQRLVREVAEKAANPNAPEPTPIPEAKPALEAQVEALVEGRGNRKAVLITPGEEMPDVPKGYVTTKTDAGTFIHDPDTVSKADVKQSVADGTFHELLGIKEARSPETTQAVVARDAKGNELQAALVSPDKIEAQTAEFKNQYPKATVSVEDPSQVLDERIGALEKPSGRVRAEEAQAAKERMLAKQQATETVPSEAEGKAAGKAAEPQAKEAVSTVQGEKPSEQVPPSKPSVPPKRVSAEHVSEKPVAETKPVEDRNQTLVRVGNQGTRNRVKEIRAKAFGKDYAHQNLNNDLTIKEAEDLRSVLLRNKRRSGVTNEQIADLEKWLEPVRPDLRKEQPVVTKPVAETEPVKPKAEAPKEAGKEPWQMTQAERQAKIQQLRQENKAVLATPLMSEGAISPTQVNRFSERGRKRWQADAMQRMEVESQIRELAKSDEQLQQEHTTKVTSEDKGRIAQLNRRIGDLTSLSMFRGKNGNLKPRAQTEVDAALAEVNTIAARSPKALADYPDLQKQAKVTEVKAAAQKRIAEREGKKATEASPERATTIDRIVEAARKPVPNIREKFELQGTDGKWYSGGFMPLGVKMTGERRAAGFVYEDRNGTTYGTKGETRQELIDRHNRAQDKEMASLRKDLEAKNDAELKQSADYWLGQQERKAIATKAAAEIRSRETKLKAKPQTNLGTGSAEGDAKLAQYRELKAKSKYGMTAAQETALEIYEARAKADPSKWHEGDGVGWKVAGNQINRGFRIVEVDPKSKEAVIRSVADTGITTSGGDFDVLGDQRVHIADLVRDNKYNATPKGYGSKNKLTTKDQATEALDRIKERTKTERGSGGPSTEELKDWLTLATYHVEAGARGFADFSKRMIDDVGDWIQPHLRSLYDKANALAATVPEGIKTGIKNATVNLERELRGSAPIEKEARKALGVSYDRGRERVDNDPTFRDQVADWAKHPKNLTDEEVGALTYDRMRLTNERRAAEDRLAEAQKSGDKSAQGTARITLARLNDQIANNDYASDRGGTQTARALSARRMMVKEDYSLARLEQRATVANNGDAIPESVRAKLTDLTERLATAEKAAKEYQEKAAQLEADRVIRNINRQEGRQRGRAITKEQLDSELADLKKQFEAERKKATAASGLAGIDPEGKLTALVVKMARNRVKAGVTDAAQVVDEVYGNVKDYLEGSGLGKRDVRDAISGYGVPPKPTKGELVREWAQVKAKLKREAKDEDLRAEGIDPTQAGALKAYKTRLEHRVVELQKQINTGDFSKSPRRPLVLDPRARELQAQVGRLKNQADLEIRKIELSKRTATQKLADNVVKWRRAVLLSSFTTLEKLTSAATQRLGFTALEEAIGTPLSKLLPEVSAKAPREGGGFNIRAEARAAAAAIRVYLGAFDKNGEMHQIIKTGKSSLDAVYGKRGGNDLPPEASEFFGRIHAALKAPAKMAEFERSLTKRLEWAARNGEDISDPAVQAAHAAAAYLDGNRAILLQNNAAVTIYRQIVSGLKIRGHAGSARTLEFLLPIVKVPTNFAVETGSYLGGAIRAGQLLRKGVENLTPDQADAVLRNLKKQTVGAGLMAVGYALGASDGPLQLGGYYQGPDERKRGTDQPKPGEMRIFGWSVPKPLTHTPPLEALQVAATLRRVTDLYAAQGKPGGVPAAAFAASKGLAERVPFYEEAAQVLKASETPAGLTKYGGETLRSLVIPPDVQKTAAARDVNAEGEPIKRKPENVGEILKMGVPGLRETVPVNEKAIAQTARRKLVEGLRKNPDDTAALDKAYDAGEITSTQRKQMLREAELTPFQLDFKHKNVEDAIKAFRGYTEAQQDQVRDLMREKIKEKALKRLPPARRERLESLYPEMQQ